MTDLAALRERLARRHGPPPPSGRALGELAVRIERLRGRAMVRGPAGRPPLAGALAGVETAPGLVLVERAYPLWHRVGRVPLAGLPGVRAEGFPADPLRCLFLDTETTGLAGGTGTVAWMVGLGRLGTDAFGLRQWVMAGFAAEAALLGALAAEVRRDDVLVSFNGKSYDLPLLATRFRMHGMPDPFAGLPHLDLRHPLRRRHGAGLPDGRLKTLEEAVLGHRRERDLPGAEAPAAWLAWLRDGRVGLLPEVARHNRADLLAMAALCQCLGDTEKITPATARLA
ncbi:MAG: ribonuclease H-like domain-containing protein [Rhodocyclaceae bacterium]|nr:ribonuclease H-like domain-containing protein [Rhodocyclaceae bacterium]